MPKKLKCTIKGCAKKHHRHGHCALHLFYMRCSGVSFVKRKPIVFNGKSNTITGWAKEIGIHPASLSERLREGWPIEIALTAPKQGHGGPRVGPKWEQMKAVRAQTSRSAHTQQGV
jgi:hypothetical protein